MVSLLVLSNGLKPTFVYTYTYNNNKCVYIYKELAFLVRLQSGQCDYFAW